MRRVRARYAWLVLMIVGSEAWATEAPVELLQEPQEHPKLTPLGYQLSAQKEQELAARRQRVKAQRLRDLAARLDEARARGDSASTQLLEAVVARVEAGPPHVASRANAWASEHVAHLRAADQWRKYGPQLDKPEVVRAFDTHALRMAKLLRMRQLTLDTPESTERDALLSQIETTIELEGTRHVEQLERWLTPPHASTP